MLPFRRQQGDFSDWGSNVAKSDDASSVVSAGGQSTQSSALGALQRIDESELEYSPASPSKMRQAMGDNRMDSFSTAATQMDNSTSRSGGGARRLESVSFADEPVEGAAAVRGGAQKRTNMSMSLAERIKGGNSPGVSRRCDVSLLA